MKVFILCGGFGTRLDNTGNLIAKPMLRIAKKPLLIHIIENFLVQGFKDFVLCTGHKHETILNYFLKENKKFVIVKQKINNKHIFIKYKNKKINFNCDIIFTGYSTATGGRIKIAYKILKLNNDFLMTYGDGLANVNIKKLINFHRKNKSQITLTAVRPTNKYGIIKIDNHRITSLDESKSKKSNIYVNGGYFVISHKSIKLIESNSTFWENEPLKYAIKKKKVFAYKHTKFWHSVDTLKDLAELRKLYSKKNIWI